MGDNNNMGEERMHDESTGLELKQRLAEEITILRIEGTLFCFDPREARRRDGTITRVLKHADGQERPVTVDIHPRYGQPSVLAYKIVQAIFLKMTEEGYPYSNTVTFSQRELARLSGRDAWGGSTSQQLYHAMMQLQTTRIVCSIQNKETKEHLEVNFYFLPETWFSKRDGSIKACMVKVADPIVQSLNRRHIAFFDLQKLRVSRPHRSPIWVGSGTADGVSGWRCGARGAGAGSTSRTGSCAASSATAARPAG